MLTQSSLRPAIREDVNKFLEPRGKLAFAPIAPLMTTEDFCKYHDPHNEHTELTPLEEEECASEMWLRDAVEKLTEKSKRFGLNSEEQSDLDQFTKELEYLDGYIPSERRGP